MRKTSLPGGETGCKAVGEIAADSPRCRHNGGQEKEVARVVVIRIRVKLLLNRRIQSTINRLVGWLAIASEVRLRPHIPVELMAQGRIDKDVPDASKLKIFDPEVGLCVQARRGFEPARTQAGRRAVTHARPNW